MFVQLKLGRELFTVITKRIEPRVLLTGLLLWAMVFLLTSSAFPQFVCQPQGSPIVQAGSLTAGDALQTGRVVRGGIPSTCNGKTNTLQNSTPVVHDAYNFVSPVTGCATVDFNAQACGGATTQAVAYSTYNPASPAANVLGDFGFSTTGIASFSFPVTSGVQYTIVVHDILESPTNVFCSNYTFTISYRTGCRQPGFDRSNDGKTDITYFRPSAGSWNILNSAGGAEAKLFGLAGDIITAGDYTGDGQTDVSTYRPTANTWFYATSQTSPETNVQYVPWGVAGDVPVPGDYDRDGKTDVAVWRPSNGVWYVLNSGTNTVSYRRFGVNGDIPVIGDFDGDLVTDFAVVRPNAVGTDSVWYVMQSNFINEFILTARFGTTGDRPVPGDYDGNGKTDIALFRPSNGTWYVLPSNAQNAVTTTGTTGFQWGIGGDIPQPGDYDGDKRTDYAVFRPSNGTWYVSNSTNGTYSNFTIQQWGTATDQPASAPYLVSNP